MHDLKKSILCFLIILIMTVTLIPVSAFAQQELTAPCPTCGMLWPVFQSEYIGVEGCYIINECCTGEMKIISSHSCLAECKLCGNVGSHKYDQYTFDTDEYGHGHFCVTCEQWVEYAPHSGVAYKPYKDYHTLECDECFEIYLEEPHDYVLTENGESRLYVCQDCGYEKTANDICDASPDKKHSYSDPCFGGCEYCGYTEFRCQLTDLIGDDASGHYKKCVNCKNIYELEAHTNNPTCSGSCEKCGYSSPHDIDYENLTFDGKYHYIRCKDCKFPYITETHIPVYSDLTVAGHTESCTECDYVSTQAHTFVNDVCKYCNYERESGILSGICGDGVIWSLDKGSGLLTVSGDGYMKNYSFPDADSANVSPFTMYADFVTEVVIEDGVKNIGSWVSFGEGVKKITLPQSITSVGDNAFYWADGLEQVVFEGIPYQWNNINFGKNNGYLTNCAITYKGVNKLTDTAFWGYDGANGTLVIWGEGAIPNYSPRTAPWIAQYQNCIYSIIVQDGITAIGDWAFSYLYYARSLKLPSTLEKVGTSAFYQCISYEEILVPENVSHIGAAAFADCKGLRRVSIPEKVNKILKFTVFDCINLETVYYGKTLEDWESIPRLDGNEMLEAANISCQTVAGIDWKFDSETGTLTISGTGKMENYTAKKTPWHGHSASVRKVVVEEGVTGIGNYSFGYFFNLTDVSLPDSLTYIGASAFYKCTSLESIDIPQSVDTVYSGAFAYCSALKTVNIPAGVMTVYVYTFLDCPLTQVKYAGTPSQLESLTVLNGNDTFINCQKTFE